MTLRVVASGMVLGAIKGNFSFCAKRRNKIMRVYEQLCLWANKVVRLAGWIGIPVIGYSGEKRLFFNCWDGNSFYPPTAKCWIDAEVLESTSLELTSQSEDKTLFRVMMECLPATVQDDRIIRFCLLRDFLGKHSVSPEKKKTDFPHVCPRCKAPAYIGLMSIICSEKCTF